MCYIQSNKLQWHIAPLWFWLLLNVWNGLVSCWLWTSRKYVGIALVHTLVWSNVALLCVRYTDCNHTIMWCRIQLQWWWRPAAIRWFWFWLNVWNGVVLVLDEQGVRWYLSLVCVWIWRCDCLVFDGVGGASCDVQLHRNGDDTWLCVDVNWIWNGVVFALDE